MTDPVSYELIYTGPDAGQTQRGGTGSVLIAGDSIPEQVTDADLWGAQFSPRKYAVNGDDACQGFWIHADVPDWVLTAQALDPPEVVYTSFGTNELVIIEALHPGDLAAQQAAMDLSAAQYTAWIAEHFSASTVVGVIPHMKGNTWWRDPIAAFSDICIDWQTIVADNPSYIDDEIGHLTPAGQTAYAETYARWAPTSGQVADLQIVTAADVAARIVGVDTATAQHFADVANGMLTAMFKTTDDGTGGLYGPWGPGKVPRDVNEAGLEVAAAAYVAATANAGGTQITYDQSIIGANNAINSAVLLRRYPLFARWLDVGVLTG